MLPVFQRGIFHFQKGLFLSGSRILQHGSFSHALYEVASNNKRAEIHWRVYAFVVAPYYGRATIVRGDAGSENQWMYRNQVAQGLFVDETSSHTNSRIDQGGRFREGGCGRASQFSSNISRYILA